jgi:hypothetical protein
MRAALGALQRVDFQMGRLLQRLFARRLHRLLGFPTAARYAQERLGLSPRKARALVALDRRSAALPALAAAYRQGEVSWVRALSLLPVADDGNAAAWVARAQAVTVRRLVDEVEWTSAAPSPASPGPLTPPGGASSASSTTCTRGGARNRATATRSLRARRLALRRAGLHVASELARSPSPLSLARRRQCA